MFSQLGFHDDIKAIEAYKKGIELATNNEEKAYLYNALGRIQFNVKNYYEALNSCEIAIKLSNNGYCQWLNKGTNLFMLGMYQQALNAINKSININPDYYLSHIWKGNTLYNLGFKNSESRGRRSDKLLYRDWRM